MLAVVAAILATVTVAESPAPDLAALIRKGEQRYAQVQGYTCLLSRTEWIEGKKTYKVQNNIILKHRKPGSYYLKWTEGPVKGTESIFVAGRNNGRQFIHYTNFSKFLTFSIKPDSRWVLRGNRHPVQEAQLGYFLEMIERNLVRASANHEGSVTYAGEETLDAGPTLRFTAELPEGKGYYGQYIAINIDRESSLPVKIEVHGWDGRLWERYQFSQVKLDAVLSDDDFDLKNPAHGFDGHAIYEL